MSDNVSINDLIYRRRSLISWCFLKVQQEKSTAWKMCNTKRVELENNAIRKRVTWKIATWKSAIWEKSGIWKKWNARKVQYEKSGTQEKCNMKKVKNEKGVTWKEWLFHLCKKYYFVVYKWRTYRLLIGLGQIVKLIFKFSSIKFYLGEIPLEKLKPFWASHISHNYFTKFIEFICM